MAAVTMTFCRRFLLLLAAVMAPARGFGMRMAADSGLLPGKRAGFVGLGAMGCHMARHLNDQLAAPLLVWNRNQEKAIAHAAAHGTEQAASVADMAGQIDVLFLSLPTTAEVEQVLLEGCGGQLKRGTVVVDLTSGCPKRTAALCSKMGEAGVPFIDCPVSGGPAGAEAGTLTTMLGGDEALVVGTVQPLVTATFSRKSVYCGPSGAGMAVKAINNALNTAHCLVAAEGLLALRNFGVAPDVALSVINSSSGKSLATEERLPQEALTGRFGYGFALPLMAKDCRIANDVVQEHFAGATLLPEVAELINAAEARPWGRDADYSEVVRVLEERAGVDLRTGGDS